MLDLSHLTEKLFHCLKMQGYSLRTNILDKGMKPSVHFTTSNASTARQAVLFNHRKVSLIWRGKYLNQYLIL